MVRCADFQLGGSALCFLFLGLLVTLHGCQGVCVFGPNNTLELAQRNDTITAEMNKTLLDTLQIATESMMAFSGFNLTAALQRFHNVSPVNALPLVAFGRLWPITWINETQGVASGASLPTMIVTEFVHPVHNALQDIATKYSFSFGLFRPKQRQFGFAGVEASLNATAILTTCQAKNVIVLRYVLDLAYLPAFTWPNTSEYANLAAMLEKTLDPYFRLSPAYAYDFVRLNVMNVSNSSGTNAKYPRADVEFYFFNESHSGREIKEFVEKGPIMTYVDSAGKTSVSIIKTEVVSETNVSSLALLTAMATSISTTESTIDSATFLASSTPPETNATTIISPTALTALTNETATLTPYASITNSVETTSMGTKSPLSPTNTTQSFLTILNGTSGTIGRTSANSSISSTRSNTSEMTSTPSGISASSSVNSYSGTPVNLSTSSLLTGTKSATASTPVAAIASTSKLSSFLNISTANLSLLENSTSLFQSNSTTSSDIGLTTVKVKSTFDPDPWFRADVPVVTKIYNDRVLVDRQMGTMAPLLQKADFYYIALPAAIGMIAAAVGCVTCLQTEWLPKH